MTILWSRVWRWLPAGMACGAALWLLWTVSPPGGDFSGAVLALIAWIVLLGVTAVMGIVGLVELPAPRWRTAIRLWPLALVPVIAALTLAAAGSTQRFMFDLHRSGLEALVAEAVEQPNRRLVDRRVGIYSIPGTSRDQHCTVIDVEGSGSLFASTGFAHCPGPRPEDATGDGYRYTPIDGPWYKYTFVW